MRFYFNFFPGRGEGVFTRAGLFPTRGTGLRQCVRVQVYTQIREKLRFNISFEGRFVPPVGRRDGSDHFISLSCHYPCLGHNFLSVQVRVQLFFFFSVLQLFLLVHFFLGG